MFSDNGCLNLDKNKECYAFFEDLSNNLCLATIVLKNSLNYEFTHDLLKQIYIQKHSNFTIPIFVNFYTIISNFMLCDAYIIGNDLYMTIKINKNYELNLIKQLLNNRFKITYEKNRYGIQNINIKK